MWNDRQAIEIFHLLFLRALGARVDPAHTVLKGGCNLRFFCKSIRYSEDIDLDARTVAVPTLRKNVDGILSAPAFDRTLRAQQLELVESSAPKQTATVQRWKLRLRVAGTAQTIPTKIEFSRRRFDAELAHEPVDAELIRRYRLYPVIVQHYTTTAAFRQKIEALALRKETQARDLFDLKLLLDAGAATPVDAATRKLVAAAIENAMGINYDDYVGQVIAYLEPEHQAFYRTRKAWDAMQTEVVAALEALQA